MATQKVTTQDDVIVQLDPAAILAEENSRYGLKDTRIQSLANSIVNQGGVMEPVEVEPIEPPVNGHAFRLTMGFYRHAAVAKLNTEGAGLTLPAIVKPLGDPLVRLKRQLAENMERETQSPMDKAVAIEKLMDAGVPKIEIREIFTTPGGRKGMKLQPLSNAMLNILCTFNDFPADIRERLHDGRLGMASGVELWRTSNKLTKKGVPKGEISAALKRIVDAAEADRIAQIDEEEGEELKLLEASRKDEEKAAKEERMKQDLAESKEKHEAAEKDVAAQLDKVVEADRALRAAQKSKDKAAIKAASDTQKSLELDAKEAQKREEEAKKELDALTKQSTRAAELAAARAKKLKEAQAKAKANGKEAKEVTATPADVKKAAAAEASGHVALKLSDIRGGIHDLTLPGLPPKAKAIGQALESWISGVITDNQLLTQICQSTGEKWEKGRKTT